MQLPTLSQLHSGLTLGLICCLGALYAALQAAGGRESLAKVAISERDSQITTLIAQVSDFKQKSDDLERASHTVVQRTTLPSGEVRETRTVDTKVEEKQASSEQVEQHTESTTAATHQAASTTTYAPPSAANWSVSAWRQGYLVPQYGLSVGLRLGPLPAWAEAGWVLGAGPLLGLRMEL